MKNVALLLIIFLVACTKSLKVPVLGDFSSIQQIAPVDSIILEEFDILKPWILRPVGERWMFRNLGQSYHYTVFDPSTGEVWERIKSGQGPGEMIMSYILFSGSETNLSVYDMQKRTIYQIDPDSLISEGNILKPVYENQKNDRFFSACENEYFYIASGLFEEGRFGVVNKQTKQIQYAGEYPGLEVLSDLSSIQKGAIFSGSLLIPKPDNTKMAFFMGGLMEIFDISTSGELSLQYAHYHFPPEITVYPEFSGPVFSFKKENVIGFKSIDKDDNFLYALYSDRSMNHSDFYAPYNSEYLLIYDWNGKPVKSYKLQKPLVDISIRGNKLYGLSHEKDPVLYIYQLN